MDCDDWPYRRWQTALAPAVGHVSVVLTGDEEIRTLNRDFRGKDKPTDVLSFSQLEGQDPELSESLGDVVISLDTAKAQSRRFGVSFQDEILRLLAHGILHLFGHDHERVPRARAAAMRAAERKLKNLLSQSDR